jgi:hypothetical protein
MSLGISWLDPMRVWLAMLERALRSEDELPLLRQTQPVFAPVVLDDQLAGSAQQRGTRRSGCSLRAPSPASAALNGRVLLVFLSIIEHSEK